MYLNFPRSSPDFISCDYNQYPIDVRLVSEGTSERSERESFAYVYLTFCFHFLTFHFFKKNKKKTTTDTSRNLGEMKYR